MRKLTRFFSVILVFLFVFTEIGTGFADPKAEIIILEDYTTPVVYGQTYGGTYPVVTQLTPGVFIYRYHFFTENQPGWVICPVKRSNVFGGRLGFRITDTAGNILVTNGIPDGSYMSCRTAGNTEHYLESMVGDLYGADNPSYEFSVYRNADLDGETADTATPISLGQTVNASMAAHDDNDWFTFTTGEGTNYIFKYCNVGIDGDAYQSFKPEMKIKVHPGTDESRIFVDDTLPLKNVYEKTWRLEPNTTYTIHIRCAYLRNDLLIDNPGTYWFSVSREPVPVTEITLQTSGTLTRTSRNKKPTLTLDPVVHPLNAENKEVSWSSSNPSVAKIDQTGKVTALKVGTTTITCTAEDGSNVSASCTITVKDKQVSRITLNKKKATLKVGKKLQLKIKKIAPADAINKKVKWTSSNKKIATVDKNGKVVAKKKGTCVITCTAKDGSGIKATCKITVK